MSISVFPGHSASWSCEVPSTIPLQFTWYLNDQLVSNVTGSHMNVTASSSYTLNNVNYSVDNSNVRCSVAVSELVMNSSDVHLNSKCYDLHTFMYLTYNNDGAKSYVCDLTDKKESYTCTYKYLEIQF